MKNSEIHVPRRIYHWINFICMVVLGVTGWYIHKPFAPHIMGLMRWVHFAFAYTFGINVLLRVYYSFGQHGEWRKYLKPKINKETVKLTFRHYLFLDHLPDGDEYRILQNASYLAVVLLFAFQTITGILLYEAEGAFPTKIIDWLGGIAQVRQAHLFLLWIFIAFTVVHIYMAFAEDFPKVKMIFFGIADEKE